MHRIQFILSISIISLQTYYAVNWMGAEACSMRCLSVAQICDTMKSCLSLLPFRLLVPFLSAQKQYLNNKIIEFGRIHYKKCSYFITTMWVFQSSISHSINMYGCIIPNLRTNIKHHSRKGKLLCEKPMQIQVNATYSKAMRRKSFSNSFGIRWKRIGNSSENLKQR